MTNLNKEKEEIIYEILLSLNNGNSCCVDERVEIAVEQYNELIKNGIIVEWCCHDWQLVEGHYSHPTMCDEHLFKCSKCGETEIRDFPF